MSSPVPSRHVMETDDTFWVLVCPDCGRRVIFSRSNGGEVVDAGDSDVQHSWMSEPSMAGLTGTVSDE